MAVPRREKKTQQLPLSVISYYRKYSNKNANIKTQFIMGTRYDIDDNYEIIDISTLYNAHKISQIHNFLIILTHF